MVKRSKQEILRDILKESRDGIKKSWIVYKCNINFELVKDYLVFCQVTELLEQNGSVYKTTASGIKYIKDFEALPNLNFVMHAR